jgi:hypothetical protein
MVGSCENGDETWGSMEGEEFFHFLGDYYLPIPRYIYFYPEKPKTYTKSVTSGLPEASSFSD